MYQSKVTHRIKYIALIITLIILASSLTACCKPTPAPATPAPEKVTLKVSGSGTTVAILEAIAPAFEADVPGYALDVLPGSGTGGGVEGIVEGVLDVAAMARPPKEEEAAQDVAYTEFGLSGIAMYAHPSVGVANLTTEQAVAIFAGDVTNWSEVGGPDQTIILYVRDEGDSSTKGLREVIFGDTPFPETATVLTSQSDMQAAIEGSPNSVGFGSWPSAVAAGTDVRAIALDGVMPDDPAYAIFGPIGIGYLTSREADVQPLIDWLTSAQGQAALEEVGVIITQ